MMFGLRGIRIFGMLIMMLICMAVAVLLIVLIVRSLSRNNTSVYDNRRAMDILNEKLASGEISEEEYNRKKMMINQR